MSNLKAIFKKQGGWRLLKQYIQSGSFFTAILQFLLLGKSRIALEILRLSAHFKTKEKLQKKYYKTLNDFDKKFENNLVHQRSNKVWVCWFQGIEQAPKLVQKCYQSLLDNLTTHEIVLITASNLEDYVKFPSYIIKKWKNGEITNTHMTDLLRLELLIQYGGLWIDATVLCTESSDNIPEYYFDSDLFLYQCLKPGRDGHSHINSSWLISAKTNNKILMATRHLCYEYWKEHNSLIDYFLLHDFMAIVLEKYPEDWKAIIPVCNSHPHILLLNLFEPFDIKRWSYMKQLTPFHKLTYKFSQEEANKKNTYYNAIFS